MAKPVLENEKIKRTYATFLREAEGKDVKTVDRALCAICEFEDSTGGKPFKDFNIDQAIKFKAYLRKRKSKRSGDRLSYSSIDVTLRMNRNFFKWLADQPGYKSRIGYSDADYFSNSRKDAMAAQTSSFRQTPSLDQVRYALGKMPNGDSIQIRDRAIVAFFALTGARIAAVASLRLKHLVLDQRRLFQDAREVDTKFGKSMNTKFFPVGDEFEGVLEEYVKHLREDLMWGPDDPLFPKIKLVRTDNGFRPDGLSRGFYKRPNALNEVVKSAFAAAQLPEFTPHSFRHMLADLGSSQNLTPKEFKAWSQNLGHENVGTTISSYLKLTDQEQLEIMGDIAGPAQ